MGFGPAPASKKLLARLGLKVQDMSVIELNEAFASQVLAALRDLGVPDEAERGAFIDVLTKDRRGLRVVVTMRADHYGHCAAYPQLARLISATHVLVGPLTPPELAAVIEAPAERVGLRVEQELVQVLISDAGSEPAVLPLLSTALLELWQARRAGWMTLDAYRAGGGLHGAIARLAEASYAQFDPGQAAVARSMFLRLAGPGEGEGVVRRRVTLSELDADGDPTASRVLQALTAARLLTTGDGFVEVAHEALLREWPRLQTWLEGRRGPQGAAPPHRRGARLGAARPGACGPLSGRSSVGRIRLGRRAPSRAECHRTRVPRGEP
jgi:hypothetical protein